MRGRGGTGLPVPTRDERPSHSMTAHIMTFASHHIQLHASVGSSLGGMQSLAAAAIFPDRVARVVSISAAARSIPYSIAMRYTQRRCVPGQVGPWERHR